MRRHIRILAGRVDRAAGSHVYHQELVCRLAARGHRVSLVCFESVPEVAGAAEVFEVGKRPGPPPRLIWRLGAVLDYLHCSRGLARLSLPPADVVIGGEHVFLKAHRCLFPRTPWIYLPHSLVVDQEIRSYNLSPLQHWVTSALYVHLQRWALRHADRTLRFTHHAARALETRYGRSVGARYAINPMGIELPDQSPRTAGGGGLRLLWVGQLIPRKRIDLALAALGGLRGLDWQFDVVGDGPARAALEQQAQDLQLLDRVRFHGFHAPRAGIARPTCCCFLPGWKTCRCRCWKR
jgi:glycosyltransferase involved in cell wall biosynthesis